MAGLLQMSAKLHYGLLFLSHLAACKKQGVFTSLQSFSEKAGFISEGYLEEIVSELKKANIVESKRGMYGGYQLARNPEDISLKEIVEIIEGPIQISLCQEGGCGMGTSCGLKSVWNEVETSLQETLSNKTLKEITLIF